ncbi:type II secretion system F family protein [Candidatus Pacearchaeota archaeon]|nr:type II secretion system F family protein [Candidatus Pacearchaeota archaeon]
MRGKDREKVLEDRKRILISGILALIVGLITYIIYGEFIQTGIGFGIGGAVTFFGLRFMNGLKETARIKRIEDVFPDFLSLVSSNLRAGMTVDRAMLLSARPEFDPLDKEIMQAGKDISTGKPVDIALRVMSKRINSEKIDKTLSIILSGIRAGGDLAILLEETSRNMRQREFVEKKAASQVLMYVIFIFLAVSVFAPGLFSLSGVLVETMTELMADVNTDSMPQNIPISFSAISISTTFIFYFSLFFIIVMDVMAALVLGLVSKGDEKEGLRYLPAMLILSLGIFFALGKILGVLMGGLA